jgi:hypothetical protein
MYIKRLASKEIFSPSNKIHREVGRANELSVPLYLSKKYVGSLMDQVAKLWHKEEHASEHLV